MGCKRMIRADQAEGKPRSGCVDDALAGQRMKGAVDTLQSSLRDIAHL